MSSPLAAMAGVLASRTLRLALGAVTGVVLARTLQPEGRGIYTLIATTMVTAIAVGHLSLEKSQIALWRDEARHRALITNALVLSMALGTAAALAAAVFLTVSGSPGASPLWAMALLAVPFGAASVNLTSVLLLQSRRKVVNGGAVAAGTVQCLPVLALAATGNVTVTSVVICCAVAPLVPFLFAVRALWPVSLRCEWSLVRTQLSLSSRYHVGLVACHLLLNVDVFLLSAMDSASAVGIYTVAVTLMALTRVPAEAITQVALPQQAVSGTHEAGRITARTLRLNLLVSGALIGLIAVTSPWVIPLVYGHAYAASVTPLLILAPGAVALTLTRLTEQYLVRLDRPMTMTAISCGALGVNLLLNLVTIPRWGAVGAALAATSAFTLLALLETVWFLRSARMSALDLVPRLTDLRWTATRPPAGKAETPLAGVGSVAGSARER